MEHFEIAAGSYEEFLLGYKFTDTHLTQSFASHDHTSSIRCLAVSDRYLASGSSDDRIIIYDLQTRQEHCLLTHHNATINCMQFTENYSHLISASADGVLALVKTGSWALEKVWDKAHKGAAILDVALHPSGKLALTLGTDMILRTWNLIKGRQAFAVNLNSKTKNARSLEKVVWAEDGKRFILYGGMVTELWDIEQGGILETVSYDSKVISCLWHDGKLLVGLENGNLCLVDESGSKSVYKVHDSRVKALAKYETWIVSASSSGEITVWDQNLKKIASANSGCRITCLVVIKPIHKVKVEKTEDAEEETDDIVVNNKKSNIVIEIEDDDHTKEIKRKKKVYKNGKTKNKKPNEEDEFINEDEMKRRKKQKRKNQSVEEEVVHLDSSTDEVEVKKKKKKKKNQIIDSEVVEEINTGVVGKSKKKKSQSVSEESLGIDESKSTLKVNGKKRKKNRKITK